MADKNDGIVYGTDGSVTIGAATASGGRTNKKEN